MQTLLIIVIAILALALWLLFVYHRTYAKEAMRIFHEKGYDQYAYTNDWWIINRDAEPGNFRIAGPFSSSKDAAKCREILELKAKTNINMWIKRIEDKKSA